MNLTVEQLFHKMLREMGPQGWWPADSKWEIILGAILVQNTNWQNVTQSLQRLDTLTGFDPEAVSALSIETLQEAIRPSGFYRNKSRAITDVFRWLERHAFDLAAIRQAYQTSLRSELLTLFGIGNETADVLLLYVFDYPVFIADNYARKFLTRLGVAHADTYQSVKDLIRLPQNFSVLDAQEFHGLIDVFGKQHLTNDRSWQASFLHGAKLQL
ncbi:endonuclease III domain-containing protein [Vagococcus acidifermentans]|uniref:Deoxyribonuclease I n=1 Tax=Vagococcus acidifermentans TaxID=564710 RepID=A0A430B2N4_9ENTE|nr:deoxyribonuclease I [Vagococcus acidifermentans]RSU14568.1 deoxyribonuclease I [Vagococcus acidifermentans]